MSTTIPDRSGLPRLHPDARAVVDGPCGLEEWSGEQWNDYAGRCERDQMLCLYRFVHIDDPNLSV